MNMTTIRLILGDQLNIKHSWFQHQDDSVLYVIAELHQEASYTTHHIQKHCAFFAAMTSFADELKQLGHQVLYLDLDQSEQHQDLPHLLASLVEQHQATHLEYQRPDEYRLLKQLEALAIEGVTSTMVDSEHFLFPFEEIAEAFPAGKHILMEHFYRKMRRRFNLLMEGDKPVGGKWNLDANNRNAFKEDDLEAIPNPLMFATDVSDILARLERHKVKNIGDVSNPLIWPINRSQALNLLAHFCQHCLPRFGFFQDAMTDRHPASWSLYHSRLSFALNSKLISPLEVVTSAITYFEKANGDISLSQIEGFVRQIIGWREYIRAVYWANMPQYKTRNHFDAKRPLPNYFWTGKSGMNCLNQVVGQSLEHAYAHHIQRLMVTGNFTLLAGINPDEVDEWYLGIYIDAIEWVEMPNTRGMALYADGGIVGTKPYAASGAYINRMSDYCKSCRYKVNQKSGPTSCPLNSLYWHFMVRHRDRIGTLPRIGMIYRNWDKMSDEAQHAILETAERNLQRLEEL
ncbi:cryptochrome/photolyase family protein [Vibrio sinaloensis]|uniref:cryptochrome/photolyase family protein n=1 Tax=Photobacterium sp. (strain ATCC 43367) TaxID=379097 RepID=UPI00057CE175|nr:cryptochrome/photolyase family protein [Vibrio sinaloensis]KHT44038.1 deoxyribodipyrimidine photolyase [Vibrio sinaloensis]